MIRMEARIAGGNLIWISTFLVASLSALCAVGGDLINLSFASYEVIYPFYASIAVGEWVKVRTDPIFDVVAAESGSLFLWIIVRFMYVFCVVSGIAALGILGTHALRGEAGFGELMWVYSTTALFFGSLSALASLISRVEHMATALAGVVWLFFVAARALVETSPITRYFYPFLRLVAPADSIWPLNKLILLAFAGLFWAAIWAVCHMRRPPQD